MANQNVSMNKIKKFLQLYQAGNSLRQISSITSMSRNTIYKYKEMLDKHPLSYKELIQCSDKELSSIVYPPAEEKPVHEQLYGMFAGMEKKLRKKGVTKYFLWEQYKSQYPQGVQYSQFCEHFRRYEQSQQLSYVMEHKAGDKVMVDFAGTKLYLTDPQTGERKAVEFFVAILPCSQLTYAEACYSQQTPDFLPCVASALNYFGGVPNALVTDNLKPAVNRASKYDPEINRSMADFALHYDIAVLPTRARKPKDKALVESAINILYSRIYAPLYDQEFTSLRDLNKAIRRLLDDHNNKKFENKPFSRRQQFEEFEAGELKPLPRQLFELRTYQEARVHPNCHVLLSKDKHHYSVPYQYVGQKVQIAYCSKSVEIYHKYDRIASHSRNRINFKYTTNALHLHPRHQYYKQWSEDFFKEKSLEIGQDTRMLIEQIFQQNKHPEQGFKTCQGVLHLAQKHGNDKVEQAASLCLEYDMVSYRKLEHIISLYNDPQFLSEEENESPIVLIHENLRGASYYK